MRTLKFRAWDNNKKEIKYFPLSMLPHFVGYELMQFTGLKDKNGKEIYEGDVVKLTNGAQYPVVWQSGGFPLFMVGGLFESDGEMSAQTEIIGNVYESPELLNNN